MNKYTVLGAEGEQVTVAGQTVAVGSTIELTEEQAAEAVAAGTLELVAEEESEEEEEKGGEDDEDDEEESD